MVTGDHLRTAISVAHQCSILPSARPVLLLDAAPPGQGIAAAAVAGVPPSLSGVKLSVLYPDGSVNESVPRSTVIPQVCEWETYGWVEAEGGGGAAVSITSQRTQHGCSAVHQPPASVLPRGTSQTPSAAAPDPRVSLNRGLTHLPPLLPWCVHPPRRCSRASWSVQ
jgi:hypothetical protein